MPRAARRRGRPPFVFGSLLVLVGVVLAAGGGWLAAIGGSWYYLATGILVAGAGLLLAKGDRWGAYFYGLVLASTLVWSLYEVQFDLWALAPRLIGPFVLGLWLLMPWVRRGLRGGPDFSRSEGGAERETRGGRGLAVVTLAVVLGAAALAFGPRLWAQVFPPSAPAETAPAGEGDWPNYGNGLDGTRHSPLAQITATNVSGLQPAWSFRTGDGPRPGEQAPREFTFEATPIKVGDSLYFCTPHNRVIALDAETGRQRWAFDPRTDSREAFVVACRGVSFFDTGQAGVACARRIVAATLDARLFEVDADTGALCAGFGQGGYVSLLDGMGQVRPGFHYQTSPPTVVNGHIILGGWINDNQSTDEPSGVVRAFDATTGQLAWAWDLGRPDRKGAPGPGETYTRGTPNAWAPFAADPVLNTVYVPTGNAPPDFYGGKRRGFDDRYSSSVVAIDIASGWPRWSFQTTHHDLWDYDVPAQPVLVELKGPEGPVPAVVQATKRGEIFVLDRRDGRLIVPAVERAVPQGAVEGERLSPTQPFSAISLMPPRLTEADMWGLTPFDQLWCRIQFRSSRYDGIFTPPGLKPTIVFPGALGVVDWGGVSVNPKTGVLVANTSAVPYRDQLIPREQAPAFARTIQRQSPPPGQPQADYAWSPQVGTPYVMHTTPFMSPLQIPCTRPPWGLMTAIDLNTRKVLWKRPIGTGERSGPLGLQSHLPLLMGTPNIGGSMTTAGGVVFNGSTLDHYVRAYDQRTGAELWKAALPAGGQATPMTYLSRSGRQFVVIAAGGHGGLQTPQGDYVVAYALPGRGG
jgi:membrane-bound PQQ-dependent dehydrogenase (glucose/quinate/shikimate family)